MGPGQRPGAGDDPVLDLLLLTNVKEAELLAPIEPLPDGLRGRLAYLLLDLPEQVPKVCHICTLQ
jgi:hypothetical protein